MALLKLIDICLKIGSGATPKGGKESYCKEGISHGIKKITDSQVGKY